MKNSRIALFILALSFVPACDGGGGGGGGAGGGPTNIEVGDDAAPFSSFTEAEATQICESIEEQMAASYDVESAMHGSCLFGGLLAKALMGGDVQTCQAAYDGCMNAEPDDVEPDPPETDDSCADVYEKVKDCNATIGELEACMEAQVDIQKAFYKALGDFDCGSEMEEFSAAQEEDFQEPAACTTLYQKCPELQDKR